jgi:hypothetical protein
MPRERGPTPPKPRSRPGWPKPLPCLVCGRVRASVGPADRIHPGCRRAAEEGDAGRGRFGL